MSDFKIQRILLGQGDLQASPYSTISSGTTTPNNADGSDGDVYIRINGTSSDLFVKKGGAWLPAGSGAGGAGGDSGLASLVYNAVFTDEFDAASGSSNDGIQTSITNATYGGGGYYTISYDSSKTINTVANAVTVSSAPSFTVQAGDMVISENQAKRITSVVTQTSYVVESNFTSNLTGAACTISQAVHTVDLNNYNNLGTQAPISSVFSTNITDTVVNYGDATTGNIPDFTLSAKVAFSASATGSATQYSVVSQRSSYTNIKQILSLPVAGTSLYLRFFAAPTLAGSGTVNLLSYEAFFHNSVAPIVNGFALNQAYCFTDSSTTPINCSNPTVVSGKTRISGLPTYTMGINPGTANGQLEVFINGQKIPRFVAGSTSLTDAYYTEITNDTIQLDSDYSGFNFSVEIVRPANVIDIGSQFALTNPVGIVLPYAGSSAPAGYLLCQGQTLNTVTNPEYSALYAVIQNTYGGTNNTNFKLPNTSGVFIRGTGSQTIGLETYTAGALGIPQNDATAKNGLSITDPGHAHNIIVYDDFNSPAGSLVAGHNNSSTPATSNNAAASNTTGITLGNGDTETRPANIALNYIIKY